MLPDGHPTKQFLESIKALDPDTLAVGVRVYALASKAEAHNVPKAQKSKIHATCVSLLKTLDFDADPYRGSWLLAIAYHLSCSSDTGRRSQRRRAAIGVPPQQPQSLVALEEKVADQRNCTVGFLRNKYAKLNPGCYRMTLGNLCRA